MRTKQHVLMIKKCMTTGLMYLCKTSSWRRDPYVYTGSGKYWKKHIALHKSPIITCVIGEFDTEQELKVAGIAWSTALDVVNSSQWANLTEEKGDGGQIGTGQLGKRWKMSAAAVANVVDSRRKMLEDGRMHKRSVNRMEAGVCRGERNYQFRGWIVTPWGKYASIKDAAAAARNIRQQTNRLDVVCDDTTLRRYIKNLDVPLHTEGRRTYPQWRGRTPREIGFYFQEEKQCQEKMQMHNG